MKKLISCALIILLIAGSISARAQQYSRFHEHPFERQALIEQLANKSSEDRSAAQAWAKANGKQMRFERDGVLYELAAIRNGKPLYYKTFNVNAAISTAASQVRNTSPYNLNGAGITVGVWDGGTVLPSHQEFSEGRVTVKDGTTASHYHATHVGGTIGASGVNSAAKGMAPSVQIDSYKWDSDLSEIAAAAATTPDDAGKIHLSNHSYGYGRGWENDVFNSYTQFGQYNYYARQADIIVAGHQYYLPFFAAGNDRNDKNSSGTEGDGIYKAGYDCVADYAIAKNVMTIGSVNDAVTGSSRVISKATMTSYSCWGPADDGRIKPDIVANGAGLTSSYNGNDSDYASLSGTSMATPNACGSAALLVEYYKELFPGEAMRASTLKGLIIHTADDLLPTGPDYKFGWGLMNTKAAADLLKDYAGGASIKLTEATVTTEQLSDTYAFQWNGVDSIRVTLCWTDPAGSQDSDDDNRVTDLVNDLDLKIAGPGGTYYPYKLDYANPSMNATATGENNIDNVEQVYIASPSAGMYTVTVDYDGSLTGGTQWYSLLVNGDSGDSDSDGMPDSWESLYFSNPTGAVAIADLDGDGSDNYTEYIAGTLPNNASSVFEVTSHTAPAAGNSPFIVNWNAVDGRIYSVLWSDNLMYAPFTNHNLSGDLPYPINTYTDAVDHATEQNYYRVDVRLDN